MIPVGDDPASLGVGRAGLEFMQGEKEIMLRDYLTSLWNHAAYPEFLHRRKGQVIGFGAFVVLIFWVLTMVVPLAGLRLKHGSLADFLSREAPEFTFSGGKLSIDRTYHYADGHIYIDVNTALENSLDPEDSSLKTILQLNEVTLLVDSDKAIFRADANTGLMGSDARMILFSDMGDKSFTKKDLVAAAPTLERGVTVFAVGAYFYHLMMFFIGVLAIAMVSRLFARLSKLRISLGEIYLLAVYTRSAPLLVKGILYLLGLNFAELPSLSLLYSVYALTRVFRYISIQRILEAGQDAGYRRPAFEFEDPRESGWNGSGRSESSRAEGGRVENGRAENGRVEGGRTESERAEDLKPDDGWSFGVAQPVIRKAEAADLDAVEAIYDELHSAEESGEAVIGWIRGVYPVRETAEAALRREDLFVLEDEGKIRGAGIINQIQVDSYEGAPWKYSADPGEVCVLHTLVISPRRGRRGYGKRFVQFYEDYAREHRMPELRIDTNARNLRARTMYRKLGYEEIAIIPTVFNNIPDVNLVLLEKHLELPEKHLELPD